MDEPLPQNPPETGSEVGPGKPPEEHRFEAGKSGNPGGRPKGLARMVRQVLGDDDGETLARFWAACLSGEIVTVTTGPNGERVEERTKVSVKDRIDVSKMLAERGWGKPAQFVPIESDDPLGMSEQAAAEAAAGLDARFDEVARKRQEREERENAAGDGEANGTT